MNRLSTAKRIKILKLLTDGGCSMQAISRVEEVSLNTVKKFLGEAGRACAGYHDEVVRGVRSRTDPGRRDLVIHLREAGARGTRQGRPAGSW